MEPDRLAEVTAAVVAQEAARRLAERQIRALVTTAVRDFHDWYSSAAITAWTRALVSRVEPVQRVLARSTDAYLARVATVMTGRTVRPVGSINPGVLRDGISHAGAYGRVADTFRYQESRLKQADVQRDLVSADQAALSRAQSIAATDAMLPPRAQSQKFMTAQRRIVGYRRVIHPELSASGTCGLCVVASDRLYKADDLMPVHEHCHCLPVPVYESNDPGSVLNKGDLTRIYEDAGGNTYGGALKRTRYKIVQHGELGPLLVATGAEFRTAADIAQDERS